MGQTQELGAGTGKAVDLNYDKVGNRTDMDYPGGTGLTIHYDDVYRLKRIIDDASPSIAIVNYRYNAAGEVERLDLKNEARTYYTYDAVGRLATLVNRDPSGLTISSYAYQRNAVGCPTRISYHDGRYRFYDYDDLYRLTREEHWTPQQANLLWHGYDYDPAGNRTSKQHDSDSGPELGYTYNNMNQLTDQVGETGNRTDVAGTVSDENLASVTVWNTAPEPHKDFEAQLRQRLFIARAVELEEDDNDLYALALDEAGNESRYPENETEFHTVSLDSSVDLDYVHDANGCLIRIEEGSTVLKEYIYDYENRLIKVVEDPGGTPVTLAEYRYDGLGRRVWSKVGGVETRFIYDGESVIEEYAYEGGWELAAVYVHGAGTDNVLAVTRDGQTFYYHYDGLGSVTELTDAGGLLAQAYEYDAWGIPTIYDPEHASGNPYLFTGRRWDAALALYYYRARHYAPDLGRFVQVDPEGYGDGTNLYHYVLNRPTVFLDPGGMRVEVSDERWNRKSWFGKTWWFVRPDNWGVFRGDLHIYSAEDRRREAMYAYYKFVEEINNSDGVLGYGDADFLRWYKRAYKPGATWGSAEIHPEDAKLAASLVKQLGADIALAVGCEGLGYLAAAGKSAKGVGTLSKMRPSRVRKLGPTAVKLVGRFGDDALKWGDDALRAVASYGDDALRLVETYGDDAFKAITKYGDDGVAALKTFEKKYRTIQTQLLNAQKARSAKALGLARNAHKGLHREINFMLDYGGEAQRTLQTTHGLRRIDNLLDGVAREVKSGAVKWDKDIRAQIRKDAWLLSKKGQKEYGHIVRKVEWHVPKGGIVDERVSNALRDAGIDIVEHKDW